MLFILVIWLIKASFVALFYEFTINLSRKIYLWVLLAVYVALGLRIAILGTLLSCIPICNVWYVLITLSGFQRLPLVLTALRARGKRLLRTYANHNCEFDSTTLEPSSHTLGRRKRVLIIAQY